MDTKKIKTEIIDWIPITDADIQRLESLDQYKRRDELCKILAPVINDEEIAVPIYEDLKKALKTHFLVTDVNDMIDPIIKDKRRHKNVLTGLSDKMGCGKRR